MSAIDWSPRLKRNGSDPKTEPRPHQANPPAAECPAERHGTGSSEEPNTRMAKKSDPRKKPRKVASKKTDFVPKGGNCLNPAKLRLTFRISCRAGWLDRAAFRDERPPGPHIADLPPQGLLPGQAGRSPRASGERPVELELRGRIVPVLDIGSPVPRERGTPSSDPLPRLYGGNRIARCGSHPTPVEPERPEGRTLARSIPRRNAMDVSLLSPTIEDLFLAASARRDVNERAAYLDEACGRDTDLRRRVEQLLAAEPNVSTFLDSPALTVPDELGALPTGQIVPAVIGPYKLLQLLGEGGMGVVYLAEQTAPVRRWVALKIIKPGMDTKEVIARFEAEPPGPRLDGPSQYRPGSRRRDHRIRPPLLHHGARTWHSDHRILRSASAHDP